MGKAKTKGKQRLDKYYKLAKEQGFRSRASYKLIQLDDKYRFLSSSRSILDLCAAPGGWMQVVERHAPAGSFIVGVDLAPILPIRGAYSLIEDITTNKCRSSVKRLMDSNGVSAFDVVLHDGSPNIGGNWSQEATTQASLVVDAVRIATEFLAPRGTFVTKVFRSQDYSAILYCLKQLFDKVEVTKPQASRSTSAEIFVVGLRYKAPANIDPRLLNVKHLFQGATAPPKIVDVLRGSKQKRNREGYEDGKTLVSKKGLVSEFIWSDAPLDFLGSLTWLSFDDPSCESIQNHELSTDEVKNLCEDLQILDKHSFKDLLRWRMRLRKALTPKQKSNSEIVVKEDDKEANENDKEGNEDDGILKEMEEMTNALERKKKRERKLLAKKRVKDKYRKSTGMQIDATEDSYYDQELFSLSSIKAKNDLVAFDSIELNDETNELKDSDDELNLPDAVKHSSSEISSDEEQRRYDDELDKFFDQAFERYIARKGGNTVQKKRAKKSHSSGAMDLYEDIDGSMVQPEQDIDNNQHPIELNPLMVPLEEDEKPTQDEITTKWFSQDVFSEAMEAEDTHDMIDSEPEIEEKTHEKDFAKSEDIPVKKSNKDTNRRKVVGVNSQEGDFEIVPVQPMVTGDSSSSSDESEEDDDYTKAEILAYAKKMMRKKQRETILDDAYNKYMFDDEGLPTWFVDEEKKHRQVMKPVTKEEVEAMKAQFKEIDARPSKKVAEAKARKKFSAMKKLEKARKKASSISDQTDISEKSKQKMIGQLYKNVTPKKPKKEFVVAKKGVTVKGGKGKVVVDRRMKSDMRSHGMGKAGRNGGPRKGGSGGKGAKKSGGKGVKKSGGKSQGGKRTPGRTGTDKRSKGRNMN